jgi:hypothetical protein
MADPRDPKKPTDPTREATPPSDPNAQLVPEEVRSRYDFRALLGRGGMGSVLRVRDRALQRDVAMKTLDGLGPEWAGTFVEEAQITAQLEHPNIVSVHDLGGSRADRRFFTMKMVHGITLTAWLQRHLTDRTSSEQLADAVEVFLKVCDALSFAHARGVVHGDIKPDNIMVGSFGEVYVMDWGLAHLVEKCDPNLGRVRIARPVHSPRFSDGPLGTPAYMPPEQAVGRVADIEPRSDVFALGAILYHILVGSPPFAGPTVEAIVEAAKHARYTPPEVAAPPGTVPPGLARVIERAMSLKKDDRYPDVRSLKQDVQRAMRGGSHLPRHWFSPGHVFCKEGQRGDEAYLVCRGTCVAYKEQPDGTRRILREMGPGSVFGEMAIISDTPRTATVEAVDFVQALVVSRRALEEGLGLDHWVGAFVKALADRFRDLDERLDAIASSHGPDSIRPAPPERR